MMRKLKKFRLLAAPLFAAFFCILFAGNSYAAPENTKRVFDEAGLFDGQEAEALETDAEKFRDETGADMAVLTIADADGMSTEEYADAFYVRAGLGSGAGDDGVLCVLDMDNRKYYVYTYGIMIRYLTDERIERILDAAYPHMRAQEYAAAAGSMVDGIYKDVENGMVAGQYLYDPETGKTSYYHKLSITWYEFLFSLIGAAAAAALPCMSVVRQYRMEKEHRQAQNYYKAYRGGSEFAFQTNEDKFLNRAVTRRRIQGPPGAGGRGPGGSSAGRSTVHRSDSGRTHGGGGRGF